MLPKILLTLTLFSFSFINLQAQPSQFIHVDQFGYLPNADKVAVLSNPVNGYNQGDDYSPAGTLEIRSASTSDVVFSGTPMVWNSGATHFQSGDKGWWFDFSSLTTPGSYYILDPVNNEQSATFEINETVYQDVVIASAKMFFYNRCNYEKASPFADPKWMDETNFLNPLQDANCRFIYDPGNATLEKDLSGGWFDAGDYNKYTTFASSAVHQLLSAYEDNPDFFGDNWNIPESGNGLPDLLDEVKWELEWLLKMVNSDGSTIIKMGSSNFSDNAEAPPSANFDQRYYGPTCTSASLAASGMFAHAAIIFSEFPGQNAFVTQLGNAAELTWNYALPFINNETLEVTCDDGSIIAGDADRSVEEQKEDALVAAIYLFEWSNESSYEDYLIDHLSDAEPISTEFWSAYKLPLQEALLTYAISTSGTPSVQTSIINSISDAAINNWNNFYGFGPSDLYRAFMPDWAYHWGSNLPKAGFGILNLQLNKYGINSAAEADYLQKAKEQLHYFHGVNPQGYVYLSNMYEFGGDRCINEIYHTWFADGSDWDHAENSLYGPAPGYVTGGPNQHYTANTNLTPPFNQPLQKSYLDFNNNWPDNSWEITEPAIYYQAYYFRLLSNIASLGAPIVSSTKGVESTQKTALQLYPNPADNFVQITFPSENGAFSLFTINGEHLKSEKINSENFILSVSNLSAGIYILSFEDDQGLKVNKKLVIN